MLLLAMLHDKIKNAYTLKQKITPKPNNYNDNNKQGSIN